MPGQAGTGAGDGMTTDRDKGDMTVRTPVLSVTYGAFSLTLEGFEDPFATMRDVAEYFRTVLAEDRAFGTRPAAPRTEALRRFAEDRHGRDVDAAAAGGRVHLRASAATTTQLRAVPQADALFDEDADTGEGTAENDAPPPEDSATAAPEAGEAVTDPLSAAYDEARADALPADDAPEADIGDAPLAPAAGRRPAPPGGDDEAAVERLISQTDNALAGAEAQRRHATFTQLKAAVAATRADVDAGGTRRPPGPAAAEIARYRDVLAQSVGPGADTPAPRRAPKPEPVDHAPASESPEDDALAGETRNEPPAPSGSGAPLILAAEQRVAGNGGAGGVSPRRIDPVLLTIDALFDEGAPAAVGTSPGFSRFVKLVAPADLAERIDAAAAYLTHVEGMEDFPRLQLMRMIADNAGGEPREDVMRCFGILLRDGKLSRSRRGQLQSGVRSAFADSARRFRDRG